LIATPWWLATKAKEKGTAMLEVNSKKLSILTNIVLGASAVVASTLAERPAVAQEKSDDWKFRASLYGFTPDLKSTAALPAGTSQINVDAGDLIDHTDAAVMGLFEAQKGKVGVFVDALYFNLGESVTDATQVSIGGAAARHCLPE
jgi:hypothetical protein